MLPNVPNVSNANPSLLAKQAMQSAMAAKNDAELKAAAASFQNQNAIRININNINRL